MSQVLKAGFQTKATLLQLAQLLVAKTHVVEEGERVRFVSPARLQVHNVEDPMRFLEQRQGLLKLFSIDQLHGGAVQFNQDQRDLFFRHFEFPVVVLVELVATLRHLLVGILGLFSLFRAFVNRLSSQRS